jgi:hypothetical protein
MEQVLLFLWIRLSITITRSWRTCETQRYNATVPSNSWRCVQSGMRGMEEQSALSGIGEAVMGVVVCREMK